MSLFDEADRSRLAPGVLVAVRGYATKDRCADMRREAGRSFMLADGSRIAPRNGPGVCPTEALIKESCAAASRPGPPPQIS